MSDVTWSMDDREVTLNYVCADSEGLACVVESDIMSEVDVAHSDQAAGNMSFEWKVKINIQRMK